jgi:hypothetical protein
MTNGAKVAKLYHSLSDKQLQLMGGQQWQWSCMQRVKKTICTTKLCQKMGNSEIAKQWFQLMAEEAVLEKK